MTSAVDIVKVGISDVKPLCSAETWESGGSGSEWGFVMNGKKVMVAWGKFNCLLIEISRLITIFSLNIYICMIWAKKTTHCWAAEATSIATTTYLPVQLYEYHYGQQSESFLRHLWHSKPNSLCISLWHCSFLFWSKHCQNFRIHSTSQFHTLTVSALIGFPTASKILCKFSKSSTADDANKQLMAMKMILMGDLQSFYCILYSITLQLCGEQKFDYFSIFWGFLGTWWQGLGKIWGPKLGPIQVKSWVAGT